MATDWIEELERFAGRAAPAPPYVRLCDYPVRLGIRQQQRTLDLVRELQLLSLDQARRPGSSVGPDRLVGFANEMVGEFAAELEAPRLELERAFDAGEPTTELRYPLTADRVAQILEYARLMDDADDLCRQELLINLEPDDEVYALRRWTVEEFVRQYHGLPPRPWRASRGEPPD